jgi:hypothetical protein
MFILVGSGVGDGVSIAVAIIPASSWAGIAVGMRVGRLVSRQQEVKKRAVAAKKLWVKTVFLSPNWNLMAEIDSNCLKRDITQFSPQQPK